MDFDFENAAMKAEQQARNNIALYKTKLFCYALLGYLVIFAALLLLVSMVGGIIASAFFGTAILLFLLQKKLIFVIIPAIWVLFKALWVRFEQPEGYVLTKKKTPVLFEEIKGIRFKLKSPKIHEVVLTPELNAAVSQIPRLGLFGFQKNTLIVGLELLMLLTPEQARSVLAHEFGHLSGNHSRFNGWIYRVRITWQRILYEYHNHQSFGARMLCRFFDWYVPRFSAYSFALARMNEYEADAISSEITAPKVTASALVTTYVTGPYVNDHYWQEYFKKADDNPKPVHLPWLGLSNFIKHYSPAVDDLSERLNRELCVETAHDDTHPSLHDRLTALGVNPEQPISHNDTAAKAWFGEAYEEIINEFDAQWLEDNKTPWGERYKYVKESKEALIGFNDRGIDDCGDEELWRFAILTEEFGTLDEAFPIFEAYQIRHPEDPDAGFALGRILFKRNDDRIIEEMEKALKNPELVLDACWYVCEYLKQNDRGSEAQWWKDKAEKHAYFDQKAMEERQVLSPDDSIIKANIDSGLKEYIGEVLQQKGFVKRAWLAKKRVEFRPDLPALAIVIQLKGFHFSEAKKVQDVVEALELPYALYVVTKGGEFKDLAKRIITIGEEIKSP